MTVVPISAWSSSPIPLFVTSRSTDPDASRRVTTRREDSAISRPAAIPEDCAVVFFRTRLSLVNSRNFVGATKTP
ncbi:hypothetical protein QR97_27910 [Streptomyces sp. PBH53]|nr:hypothetical protein QR97_27910 [Streptomyces sp. PBH53]